MPLNLTQPRHLKIAACPALWPPQVALRPLRKKPLLPCQHNQPMWAHSDSIYILQMFMFSCCRSGQNHNWSRKPKSRPTRTLHRHVKMFVSSSLERPKPKRSSVNKTAPGFLPNNLNQIPHHLQSPSNKLGKASTSLGTMPDHLLPWSWRKTLTLS